MYDHILGETVDVQPARAVLRAGGVGYELEVPTSTSATLRVGETAQLYTILHVVDGTPSLLGFAQRSDRQLAKLLLSVSGVGKAIALAILSTYTPVEVVEAIHGGDHLALKRVKGVGAKTAERLCLELRDNVAKLGLQGRAAEPIVALQPQAALDAMAALMTLGYSEKEARDKVGKVRAADPEADTEALIKAVLRG